MEFPTHLTQHIPRQDYKQYFDALTHDDKLDELYEIFQEARVYLDDPLPEDVVYASADCPGGPHHPDLVEWATAVLAANIY